MNEEQITQEERMEDTAAPRVLNSLQSLVDIAKTAKQVVDEVTRIQGSDAVKQILRKGKAIYDIVTDATEEAADEVDDIVVLALQIYEQSHFRAGSRAIDVVKDPDVIETRDDLITRAVSQLHH